MSYSAASLGDLLRALHATEAALWPSVAAAFGWPDRQSHLSFNDASGSALEPPDSSVIDQSPTQCANLEPQPDNANLQTSLPRQAPPDWLTLGSLPTEEEFDRRLDAHTPARVPLCRPGQVASFLRRRLARKQANLKIDVEHAVNSIAQQETIVRPKFEFVVRWPARVQLVYDCSHAIRPHQCDMRALAQQISRTLGPRLRLFVVDGMPGGSSTQDCIVARPLLDGSPVVVLGAAGMEQPGSAEHEQWCALGRRLQAVGCKPLLLSSVPRRMASRETSKAYDTVLLDVGKPMHVLRPSGLPESGAVADSPRRIESLRAALHGNPWTTPAALRELRLSLQALGESLDAGSETEIWRDPDVSSHELACTVRTEARARIASAFGAMPDAFRCAVAMIQWKHLRSASALVRSEYARSVAPMLPAGSTAASSLAEGLEEAMELTRRACMALVGSTAPWTVGLAGYIGRMCDRSPEVLKEGEDALHAAWVLANRNGLAASRTMLPKGLRLHRVLWALDPTASVLDRAPLDRSGLLHKETEARDAPRLPAGNMTIPDPLLDLLYRQNFRGALIRFFRSRGVDVDTAHDLFQDVVMRAIGSFNQYRGDGTLTAWVMAIANRRLIDESRRRREHVVYVDEDTWSTLAESTPATPQRVHRARVEMELQNALLAFEQRYPLQAQALRLVYLDGLSIVQLSSRMDRTHAATRIFVAEARKQFRPYVNHLRDYIDES